MIAAESKLISHLVELRSRLIKASVVVIALFLGLMPWASHIYDLLALPMMDTLPPDAKMIATGVITPFIVPIKITMLVAFVIVLPWVFYQVWAFVSPGLHLHERKVILPLAVASSLLFLLGVAFCHFFVFGVVFQFINDFAPSSISVAPDIENYFSFVLTMFLTFGLTFEVPVAIVLLVKMEIVAIERLKEIRPYSIVAAFVISAVVTPPDVVSQLMLALPLCALYEIGLIVASSFLRFGGTTTEGLNAQGE